MCAILLVGAASAEMASLEEVLRRYQHRIIRSCDSRTALAIVRTGGMPDIIVADMAAAGPKGQDLLPALRQGSPRIPVILLSPREGHAPARDLGDHTYVLGSTKVTNMERMITAIVTKGKRSVVLEHTQRRDRKSRRVPQQRRLK